MRLKKSYEKKAVKCLLKAGNDYVQAEPMPGKVVEELLRTEEDRAEDGPTGYEVRLGGWCFPKSAFYAERG